MSTQNNIEEKAKIIGKFPLILSVILTTVSELVAKNKIRIKKNLIQFLQFWLVSDKKKIIFLSLAKFVKRD